MQQIQCCSRDFVKRCGLKLHSLSGFLVFCFFFLVFIWPKDKNYHIFLLQNIRKCIDLPHPHPPISTRLSFLSFLWLSIPDRGTCTSIQHTKYYKSTHPFLLSVLKSILYCSCAVNCNEAYGMIRAIVALFPRKRPRNPFSTKVCLNTLTAPFIRKQR